MTTLQEQLNLAAANPHISTVEIDIIDGYFADTVTVSPLDLVEAEFGALDLQLHLMTNEPQDFVFEAVPLKRSLPIRAIIGQIEHMSYQHDFLSEVKVQGWQAGLALNLYTPVDAIDEASWEKIDILELLAVEAGSQGQAFDPSVLKKIAEVKEIIDGLDHPVEIVIDGGIKRDILTTVKKAGADAVSVGSGIWQAADPEQALTDFLTLDSQD